MAENIPVSKEPQTEAPLRRSGVVGRAAVIAVLVVLVAAVLWMKRSGGAPAGSEAGRISSPVSEAQVEDGRASTAGDAATPSSGSAVAGGADQGSPVSTSSSQGDVVKARPRLVDLGAGTCIPCKMMAPILDELRETYKEELEVVFIDVRQDNAAAKKYGITVIPTQIFYDASGKERFRHQGFFSREDILAKWKELGVELDG